MLVLTRKRAESIMIGDDIEITVLAVSSDKVRLGIDAPQEVAVFRTELYLEKQQERLELDSSAREEVNEALKRLSND